MKRNLLVILLMYALSISSLMGQSVGATLTQNDEQVNTYWLNTVPFYSLPKMKEGKYYNSLLKIKIPRDTIISVNGRISKVHIENITVISVEGIPKGISYSPSIVDKDNNKHFSFYLELYGRAQVKPKENISAELSVTLSYNNGKSLVRTYRIKNIILKEDSSAEFETGDNGIGLKSLKSYPNPINDITEVSFWSSKLQLVEFEVRDAIGNLKFKKTFTAKMGSNKISFSQKDLPNGLYLYSIKNEDITLAKRLIVK